MVKSANGSSSGSAVRSCSIPEEASPDKSGPRKFGHGVGGLYEVFERSSGLTHIIKHCAELK